MPTPTERLAPFQPNDRLFLLIGIPTLAVLVLLPRGLLHVRSVSEFLVAWTIALGFTTSFWLTGRAMWISLFRRFPQVEQTVRRLWWLAIINTLITAVITLILGSVVSILQGGGVIDSSTFLFEFSLNMIPTVIIQLIYESSNMFRQWEANVRRAEQLQSAGVQSQLEALRNQLDPHFLFNSLNTLSALIEPGNEPAQQFVEQLSDVYRYVLLSRDQATVPLREELAFVETYVALHQVRFRDKLRVEYQIPAAVQARRVAPLSVQLLVENALKHNVASQEQPLVVTIAYEPDANYLCVQNPVRLRAAGLRPPTQVGLANVRRRYELLQAPQPVRVDTDGTLFSVRLPLLPPAGQ